MSSSEANRKSKKLLFFVKMAEIRGGLSMHLQTMRSGGLKDFMLNNKFKMLGSIQISSNAAFLNSGKL